MKQITECHGCDLSQPCGRCLLVDTPFHMLEGKWWYVRVVVRGTIGYFSVESEAVCWMDICVWLHGEKVFFDNSTEPVIIT